MQSPSTNNNNKKPSSKNNSKTNQENHDHHHQQHLQIKTNNTTSIELLKTIPNKDVENKFDEVIESIKIIDNTCYYQKCKQKTNLMGVDCQFCRQKYCFKHGLPEVHGCGSAVKHDERKKFLHPVPEKTKREQEDLKQAHKKLNAKLKDMQISRLSKPKSNKKNKNDNHGAGGASGSGGGGGGGVCNCGASSSHKK